MVQAVSAREPESERPQVAVASMVILKEQSAMISSQLALKDQPVLLMQDLVHHH